jgi:hypothetical protein
MGQKMVRAGNPYLRGRLSTDDLLILTNFDKLLLIMKKLITLFKNLP